MKSWVGKRKKKRGIFCLVYFFWKILIKISCARLKESFLPTFVMHVFPKTTNEICGFEWLALELEIDLRAWVIIHYGFLSFITKRSKLKTFFTYYYAWELVLTSIFDIICGSFASISIFILKSAIFGYSFEDQK